MTEETRKVAKREEEEEEEIESRISETGYNLRPQLKERFKRAQVEALIQATMKELTVDNPIPTDDNPTNKVTIDLKQLSAEIARRVQENLVSSNVQDSIEKDSNQQQLQRYKYIVQVISCDVPSSGQQGARMDAKCLWDSATDNYAQHLLKTEKYFINCTVFGIYCY